MTEKKSIKSESFWSDFSRIYKNPSLIDKYLIQILLKIELWIVLKNLI